ncbi:hypothetical protein KEJ33_06100, partial [Candidatus Bathyarchaeota archaeon]|nr:hypothetical protein [Candidatus Bathyarchaeota archaeon]
MSRRIAEVKIEAGVHDRVETPVCFQLQKLASLFENQEDVYLEIGSVKIPVQVVEQEGLLQGYFILPYAKAGETLRGNIILSEGEGETGFSYDLKEDALIVKHGKNTVACYNYGKSVSKPYLYPVFSTNGV